MSGPGRRRGGRGRAAAAEAAVHRSGHRPFPRTGHEPFSHTDRRAVAHTDRRAVSHTDRRAAGEQHSRTRRHVRPASPALDTDGPAPDAALNPVTASRPVTRRAATGRARTPKRARKIPI